MSLTFTIDVQLNPDAIRILMQIPRDILEGRTPMPAEIFNRRAMLKQAESTATILRTIFLGLKPLDDTIVFGQLRDEVAEFGNWVKKKLEEEA